MNGLSNQRLVALFGAGILLFNFPLLALWDRNALVLGVPLFPVALFVIWAVLIGALGWIVERHRETAPSEPDAEQVGGAAGGAAARQPGNPAGHPAEGPVGDHE